MSATKAKSHIVRRPRARFRCAAVAAATPRRAARQKPPRTRGASTTVNATRRESIKICTPLSNLHSASEKGVPKSRATRLGSKLC
jgi:hypothetical protein